MSAEAEYVRRERDSILQTLDLVDDLVGKAARSQYETIALGKLLQDVYTGTERILRTVVEGRGVSIEKGEGWHKALLLAAKKLDIINDDEFEAFRKLLLFRHVQVHGYGVMLEEKRLIEIAGETIVCCRSFLDAVV